MTLTEEARNAAVDAVVALFDSGDIQFQTAADNEVATLPFAATAFGAAVSGTATANTITDDTSAAGGTIDHAVLRKSDNTEVIEVTCGLVGSGQDIELTSLSIGTGDTVSITSMTMTMPAS